MFSPGDDPKQTGDHVVGHPASPTNGLRSRDAAVREATDVGRILPQQSVAVRPVDVILRRAQSKRIREIDRIPVSKPVEIQPPGEANGIFLGKCPDWPRSYCLNLLSCCYSFL